MLEPKINLGASGLHDYVIYFYYMSFIILFLVLLFQLLALTLNFINF